MAEGRRDIRQIGSHTFPQLLLLQVLRRAHWRTVYSMKGGGEKCPSRAGRGMDGRVRAPLVGLLAAVQSMPIRLLSKLCFSISVATIPGLTGAESLHLAVISCYARPLLRPTESPLSQQLPSAEGGGKRSHNGSSVLVNMAMPAVPECLETRHGSAQPKFRGQFPRSH